MTAGTQRFVINSGANGSDHVQTANATSIVTGDPLHIILETFNAKMPSFRFRRVTGGTGNFQTEDGDSISSPSAGENLGTHVYGKTQTAATTGISNSGQATLTYTDGGNMAHLTGYLVSGHANIPAGTRVTSVGSGVINISQNLSGNVPSSTTLTFTPDVEPDASDGNTTDGFVHVWSVRCDDAASGASISLDINWGGNALTGSNRRYWFSGTNPQGYAVPVRANRIEAIYVETASRSDTGCTRTNGSPIVSDNNITADDLHRSVSGTGIPTGSYIISVDLGASPKTFTMNNNATASSSSATINFGGSGANSPYNAKRISGVVSTLRPIALVMGVIDGGSATSGNSVHLDADIDGSFADDDYVTYGGSLANMWLEAFWDVGDAHWPSNDFMRITSANTMTTTKTIVAVLYAIGPGTQNISVGTAIEVNQTQPIIQNLITSIVVGTAIEVNYTQVIEVYQQSGPEPRFPYRNHYITNSGPADETSHSVRVKLGNKVIVMRQRSQTNDMSFTLVPNDCTISESELTPSNQITNVLEPTDILQLASWVFDVLTVTGPNPYITLTPDSISGNPAGRWIAIAVSAGVGNYHPANNAGMIRIGTKHNRWNDENPATVEWTDQSDYPTNKAMFGIFGLRTGVQVNNIELDLDDDGTYELVASNFLVNANNTVFADEYWDFPGIVKGEHGGMRWSSATAQGYRAVTGLLFVVNRNFETVIEKNIVFPIHMVKGHHVGTAIEKNYTGPGSRGSLGIVYWRGHAVGPAPEINEVPAILWKKSVSAIFSLSNPGPGPFNSYILRVWAKKLQTDDSGEIRLSLYDGTTIIGEPSDWFNLSTIETEHILNINAVVRARTTLRAKIEARSSAEFSPAITQLELECGTGLGLAIERNIVFPIAMRQGSKEFSIGGITF